MNQPVIDAALEHWALGNASVQLVAARENHVYRVETETQRYALRLHRCDYRSVEEIQSELLWMDMLSSHQVPVPKPLPAPDGSTVISLAGVVVDVLSWVSGSPLSKVNVTTEMYVKLGELLAQMHRLTDQWSPPGSFIRPVWDLVGEAPSWGHFWDNPQLTSAQQERFKKFRDHARQLFSDRQSLDFGLIHADLVPDNILYERGQLRPIDFDDGGYGYRLFDLATVTFRNRTRQNSDALAEATVSGYTKLREADVEFLPLFEALRACTYVGWNISRMHEAGGVERNARFITEAEAAIERYRRQV